MLKCLQHGNGSMQRRGLHTAQQPCRPRDNKLQRDLSRCERRNLYLKQSQAASILHDRGVAISTIPPRGAEQYNLAVSIDRSRCAPCLVASSIATRDKQAYQPRRFPFDYRTGVNDSVVTAVAEHLGIPPCSRAVLSDLIRILWDIFTSKEAFLLELRIALGDRGDVHVLKSRFGFDDAAFKSKRQLDVQMLRDVQEQDPEEVEAEKDGIVYIRFVQSLPFMSDN